MTLSASLTNNAVFPRYHNSYTSYRTSTGCANLTATQANMQTEHDMGMNNNHVHLSLQICRGASEQHDCH